MKIESYKNIDVCIITTIHPPYDARIYERGLKSLLEYGFSICLVSPWKKPQQNCPEIKWISLKMPSHRLNRILHGFKTFIAAFKQPAKIYQFHDIDFILWAVLLKFLKHTPVVYDCHENHPEEVLYNKDWVPKPLRKILAKSLRLIENWCVKKFHYCIAVVPNLIKRFRELGVKTVLVRNFVDREPHRNLKHQKALIYIGKLLPSYGSDVLLGIARELKSRNSELSLILTDWFPSEEKREKYLNTIKKENLPVIIHPKVPPHRIDILLSKACIGLSVDQDLPNMRVAYHTKLFEYMAMGLPIIASDLPTNREIINGGNCGLLVSPDDAKQYVDAAVTLLDNSQKFKTFKENGFNAIDSIYNWKMEKKKLIDFFKEIMSLNETNSHY